MKEIIIASPRDADRNELVQMLKIKSLTIRDLIEETKQLKELLKEAVADSTALYSENKKIKEELSHTEEKLLLTNAKLSKIKEESSIKISGKSVKLLNAELFQAREALVRAGQTLTDLVILTAGLRAIEKEGDRPFGSTLDFIEETVESIQQTILETSG